MTLGNYKVEQVKMLKDTDIVPFWVGHYLGLPYSIKGRDRSGLDDWV